MKSPFVEGIILPNLEDPDAPVEAWGRPVPPVGFGPVGVGWLPRAPLAGSGELGAGGLPSGYDRRFANAAPTALQTKTGWLLGNEAIRLVHIGSAAIIETALPGIPPPEVHFHCRRGPHVRAVAPLDTVVIDADAGIVTLRWRAHVVLSHGYADLLDVAVENPAPALAPIPVTI